MTVRKAVVSGLAALVLGGQPAFACTETGTTRVDEVYPSSHAVPENILRFYIYFTGPMSHEDILPNIELTIEDGSVVDGAFLSNRFELWSPDRTRLTLLFDPGRVKTGLEAHEALGRALVDGQRYTLVVDGDARDAAGCRLESEFAHSFEAVPADLDPPDPGTWQFRVPEAGTAEPIRVSLGSPHDHLSLAFRMQIRRNGQAIPGRLELSDSETTWVFTPRSPWSEEMYEISVDQEFEDLAGNRPGQLFDQLIGSVLPMPLMQLQFSPRID